MCRNIMLSIWEEEMEILTTLTGWDMFELKETISFHWRYDKDIIECRTKDALLQSCRVMMRPHLDYCV